MLNGVQVLDSQLPATSSDAANQEVLPRGNRYAENYFQSTSSDGLDPSLAEGSYFSGVISGYVPGSGFVTGAVQTTFSDTSALMVIANKANSGSKKIIRPDTLKLIVNAAGTGITAMRLVGVIDAVSRLGTPGGSGMVFNPVGGIAGNNQSLANAFAGALTIGAVTPAKKIVGQCVLKNAVPVANDEFLIRFSNAAAPSNANVRHMEPVVILPGQVYILHAFYAGVTVGANFEPLLTTIER